MKNSFYEQVWRSVLSISGFFLIVAALALGGWLLLSMAGCAQLAAYNRTVSAREVGIGGDKSGVVSARYRVEYGAPTHYSLGSGSGPRPGVIEEGAVRR